ncbi:MAG: hypothetical protein M2R45_04506 [Verrucomicrobia subdivision 3 bacterium]|nr:hypothetical protein [Limisphaerales bacterium]MCS1415947.1 hypothetical protein [Limisphaerales bacterium]
MDIPLPIIILGTIALYTIIFLYSAESLVAMRALKFFNKRRTQPSQRDSL